MSRGKVDSIKEITRKDAGSGDSQIKGHALLARDPEVVMQFDDRERI